MRNRVLEQPTEVEQHEQYSEPVPAGWPVHRNRDRGLFLIALFKLSKTVFFFAIGLGIVHLMHKDVGALVLRVATALRFDPDGRLVNLLMSHVDAVDAHRLLQLGVASFAYSFVTLVEGTGLLLEKVWAEYLTLTLTVLFLPWECYELLRGPTVLRGGLLVVNLLVLGYLVSLLRKRGRL